MSDNNPPSDAIDLSKTLTIYGRKPVLEALSDQEIQPRRLHLADSNRAAGIITDIVKSAEGRGIEIRHHDKRALSRISKNGKQDQGVALDIDCPNFRGVDELAQAPLTTDDRFLVLDGITNPQNVGMIIRSALAADIAGIVYPKQGVAALGPLVIKASAGTAMRAPLIRCANALEGVTALKASGVRIVTLAGDSDLGLNQLESDVATAFVLGGETDGVSDQIRTLADCSVSIPMANKVESLNVAVTAALVAYLH
ncbi:MAG: RNA methyltransferase [Luminiphilus sp.]|nr:RNA methyltransferase [Luminiphilus sp.]